MQVPKWAYAAGLLLALGVCVFYGRAQYAESQLQKQYVKPTIAVMAPASTPKSAATLTPTPYRSPTPTATLKPTATPSKPTLNCSTRFNVKATAFTEFAQIDCSVQPQIVGAQKYGWTIYNPAILEQGCATKVSEFLSSYSYISGEFEFKRGSRYVIVVVRGYDGRDRLITGAYDMGYSSRGRYNESEICP